MSRAENASTPEDQIRLPAGIVLTPPLHFKEMADDIDHDPEEAEALVALIQKRRREGLPDSAP